MYCLIKYNDTDATMSDDDKILYINPDCVLKILLDYVRQKIGIDSEFDLANEDGELKFVNDFVPEIRATDILVPFAIYVVVLIERADDGNLCRLTPLISKVHKQFSELTLKLKRYINPSKRFSYELKKPRRSSEKATKSTVSNDSNRTRPTKSSIKKS